MQNILVIARTVAESDECRHLLSKERFPNFRFLYPGSYSDSQDYLTLFQSCYDVINKENVIGVISCHDGYQLIHAALAKHFPHIKSPSIDFVCSVLNRFYSRQIRSWNPPNNVILVPIEDKVQKALALAIEETAGPFVIKDILRRQGGWCKLYRHPKDLWKDAPDIKKSLRQTETWITPLLTQYANVERFTHILESALLVEEPYDAKGDIESRHQVEWCVADGDFIPWAICDKHYWPRHPGCLKGVSMPSTLTEHSQVQIWATAREITQALKLMDLDNYFLRAEVAVMTDGSILIVDLGCGLTTESIYLYRQILINGDSAKALLDLATDNVVRKPKILHGRHVYKAVFTTFSSGKVSELFDVKKARTVENLRLAVSGDLDLDAADSPIGTALAMAYISGVTNEDCLNKAREIAEELYIDKSDTPWFTSDNCEASV